MIDENIEIFGNINCRVRLERKLVEAEVQLSNLSEIGLSGGSKIEPGCVTLPQDSTS